MICEKGKRLFDMSCFHPLRRFVVGVNEETGKTLGKITNEDIEYCYKTNKNSKIYCSSYPVPLGTEYQIFREFTTIPCCKCFGCKLDYARNWANRIFLESKQYTNNYFLTLTYNDNNLPEPNEFFDPETGQSLGFSPFNPLVKSDLQKFMKRLRKKFGDNIRFFASGEYGSKSMRPHYHIILLNCPLNEELFQIVGSSPIKQEYIYYITPEISQLWSFGFHTISKFSYSTAGYVARYCTKKLFKDNDFFDKFNVPKEFTLMSRMPGIGYDYLMNNYQDIYKTNEIFINSENPYKCSPPKYFDYLVEKFDLIPDFDNVKNKIEHQRVQETLDKLILENTSLDYKEYDNLTEQVFLERVKILDRNKV